jgi:hypothetical protein
MLMDGSDLGSFSGIVTNGNNEPVEGVEIKIDGLPFDRITNALGAYRSANLTAGEYEIEASKEGYPTQNLTVTIVAGQAQTLNIAMRLDGPQYAVTFNTPTNGTLTATENSVAITSGTLVDEGAEVVFTATPATNYRVKDWTITGVETLQTDDDRLVINPDGSQTLTLTVVDEPIHVEVEFEINTYAFNISVAPYAAAGGITVKLGDNAEIDLADADLSAVPHGTSKTLTATAGEGYEFEHWEESGSVVHPEDVYQFIVTEGRTLTAVFVEKSTPFYTVTFSVVGGNGTLTAKADGVDIETGDEVEFAAVVVLTATPDEGYKVKTWMLNDEDVTKDAVNNTLTLTMSENAVVTVEFEIGTNIAVLSRDVFTVYPNPVADFLTIESTTPIRQIEMIDLNGRVVRTWLGDNRTINVEGISGGNYVLRIHTENSIVPIKIVKQ